jgi:hypothetical protein
MKKPKPKFKVGDIVTDGTKTFEIYHVTNCQKAFGYPSDGPYQWAYGAKGVRSTLHIFEQALTKVTKLHKALQ